VPFVSYLVREKILGPREVAEIASQDFGVPLFDLDVMDPDLIPRSLVDEKLIRNHQALPLYRRATACSWPCPTDKPPGPGRDQVPHGLTTNALVVEDDKLSRFIDKALDRQNETFAKLLDTDLEKWTWTAATMPSPGRSPTSTSTRRLSCVSSTKWLLDAINQKASISTSSPTRGTTASLPPDGMLHEVLAPRPTSPRAGGPHQVMARLNTAERRVPQNGASR